MLRRFITSLVLLGFIVSQLAALPHAHGAASSEEQRRHDAHPHVHIGFGGHTHANKPAKPVDTSPGDEHQAPDGLGDQQDGDDHDANAIYLPGAGSPALGSDRSLSVRQSDIAFTTRFGLHSFSAASDEAANSFPWRPPDDVPPACPVFLKLRTIRISRRLDRLVASHDWPAASVRSLLCFAQMHARGQV